jgi:ribosomal-protein-alanine N-acetyltransferase
MQIDKTLSAKSVYLRNLTEQDATAAYLGWLSDPDVNAYLEVRFSPPKHVDELARFIRDTNKSPDSLLLGIFVSPGDRHIGNIKLGPIDWHHLTGDVGFLIGDKRQWGKGLASTAIGLISDYALTQLGLAKVTAGCYARHEGSRRALLKAGFVEEGRRISQWFDGKHRQDGLLFGRVKSADPAGPCGLDGSERERTS